MWATHQYVEGKKIRISVLQAKSHCQILYHLSGNWADCCWTYVTVISLTVVEENPRLAFLPGELGPCCIFFCGHKSLCKNIRMFHGRDSLFCRPALVRIFFFPQCRKWVISIRKKSVLKYVWSKNCAVCVFFSVWVCVGVSGPNIFDILITCRMGNAALKETHCGAVKNAPFRSQAAPSVCLLKCGCLEKLCPWENTWLPTRCLTARMLCEMRSLVPSHLDLREADLQRRQVSASCWNLGNKNIPPSKEGKIPAVKARCPN